MCTASLGRLVLTLAAAAAVAGFGTPAVRANASTRPSDSAAARSRAAAERDFLRGTPSGLTANGLTSDVDRYIGTHVAMICTVDTIVRADTIIAQCGRDVEPVDLYVQMTTKGRHLGERMRILGIVQAPAMWVDAMGHQVLYPIIRAVFVDPTTAHN